MAIADFPYVVQWKVFRGLQNIRKIRILFVRSDGFFGPTPHRFLLSWYTSLQYPITTLSKSRNINQQKESGVSGSSDSFKGDKVEETAYLSSLKEFGLNPKDWNVNLKKDGQKPGWQAHLVHKSTPQVSMTARCFLVRKKNNELVFAWSELRLV